MSMNRQALKVISTVATPHGYVIRNEIWPSLGGDDEPMPMTTCYTDDGYWIGDEAVAKQLCEKLGIAPEQRHPDVKPGDLRPCSIGFCEKDQKWFGWSHRAIFGFGIGSEVKKGDCAYVPTSEDDFLEDAKRFWDEPGKLDVSASWDEENGERFALVRWTYASDSELIPNTKLHGKEGSSRMYPPDTWGRGEWTAETLEDARQMAEDFAEGVS